MVAFSLLGILLALTACTLPKIPDLQRTPENTLSVPTSSPQVLFQDDFSDPFSGWSTFNEMEGLTEYVNGTYRIFINKPNWFIWGNPGKNFTNVIVEVEAVKVGGPEENDFGVICRYQDERNFYRLFLGSDGYYGISKVIDGEELLIDMEELQYNEKLLHSENEAVLRIQARCVGEHLSLWVNGQVLAEVDDASLTSGDVGLVAGTYDTPGVDIRFDNLLITQP